MNSNNKNITSQTVNYGTMDTTDQNSSQNKSDQTKMEQATPSGISQTPPKPAVRQRIQRIQKQLQEAAANSKTNISVGDGVSTSYLENNKSNIDLNRKRADSMIDMSKQSEASISRQVDHMNQESAIKTPTSATKGSILPLPSSNLLDPPKQRPYPKKIFFIVANEFCERFSYYGLRAILVLYFKTVLGFSDSNSTVSFHLFATLCYLTPVLGAILADSVWGKFKTILYLSILYLLGEIILVAAATFWNFNELSVTLSFFGLILIGIGTGGIKPCVNALGGDQFLPDEISWRESFFSLFYGAINLGALASLFLTPVLRSQSKCVNRSDCYPLAFGVPAALMLLAILLFLAASNHYVLHPLPSENVMVAFCRCTWLAFRRKLAGHKLPKRGRKLTGQVNNSLSISGNTSSSSLSSLSDRGISKPTKSLATITTSKTDLTADPIGRPIIPKNDHWLYLASDQFSAKSIEDFRSVWRFILLFLPTPVYWTLFDQQGSLWTLQATRMDGRLFGTDITLEPDQMSVANPILLLSTIPIFHFIIYPSLNKCNLLTTPIQKMSVGGLVAALTFVASAMIELKIQNSFPSQSPAPGYANLLLVNGLSDCSIVNPTVSYIRIPDLALPSPSLANGLMSTNQTNINDTINYDIGQNSPDIARLEPLSSLRINLLSGDYQSTLNNYKFTFRLSNDIKQLVGEKQAVRSNTTEPTSGNVVDGCPFDSSKENEFLIGPMNDKAVKLLYIEQGNGKLTYKLFNDSYALPTNGTARVRLLYEFFGSFVDAEKRSFNLLRLANTEQENAKPHPELQLKFVQRNGQVLITDYVDIPVPIRGDLFQIRTNDDLLNGSQNATTTINLKPGTRNLLIVHQLDAKTASIKQELLQNNDYRVSMLYQLIPYLMISVSEIMFSIPTLELAYEMAPVTMKSIVLAFGSLTVAMGNILTVAVESIHPFSNVVHDFLFYAFLMTLDILIFAFIGFYYAPRHVQLAQEIECDDCNPKEEKDGAENK